MTRPPAPASGSGRPRLSVRSPAAIRSRSAPLQPQRRPAHAVSSTSPFPKRAPIRIRGARQNNLKNLDLDIPTGELVVVTGVSGSGKSSLVFDTLYAEGQRRYVETFSAYARQFLDRMDKPQVDRIEGVPPAIAIDQTNPVRTSRSTVGTMTELNDHLKLLFARVARLSCRHCGRPVRRDSTASIVDSLRERAAAAGDPRVLVCFAVTVPVNFTEDEIRQHLLAQGYTRVHSRQAVAGDPQQTELLVIQDRFRVDGVEAGRLAEAVETALQRGQGRMSVHVLADAGANSSEEAPAELAVWRYASALACADCGIAYHDAMPSLFSFNSPIGACETCRGFGRVIGIDLGLVIPDETKTLRQGAVRPWQSESFKECQVELLRYGQTRGIRLDVPWRDLDDSERSWVVEGGDDWTGNWRKQWYGVRRFFDWLESKAYKMHIRVLLSRYRSYTPCTVCQGSRLKPDALLWRLGSHAQAETALSDDNADGSISSGAGSSLDTGPADVAGRYQRFRPIGVDWDAVTLAGQPGLCIHDVMLLPIERLSHFFATLELPAPFDEAADLLLTELRARLAYLGDVGLGYLTLDRQSRTLSGGEVQRINLTTALGTSLVNTLFVLDEPSIGLHPRDMDRIIGVMNRLRDAGNSLVVVEHDPQVMVAADRILDIGPGPGERGGQISYYGPAAGVRDADTLTGDYLSGRREVAPSQHLAVKPGTPRLLLEGAREHNLRGIDVEIPLGRLVCLTGVSGSGKSTLMQDVLLPALRAHFGQPTESAGQFARLLGAEMLADVVYVDQSPIGKTTRSNPASYVGAFDAIRKRFAQTDLARERGYTAGTFSFNSGDGRCPTCGGNGFEHVEMQFLSDVYLRCPDCDGRRFRAEVLEVTLAPKAGVRSTGSAAKGDDRKGVQPAGADEATDQTDQPDQPTGPSIADILAMTVSEALTYFTGERDIRTALQPLIDVGLDYLSLGQPVPTLSGGEAQRLKLAGFLAKAAARTVSEQSRSANADGRGGMLFMFDEPTTGLHFDDVARLLRALRKLQAAGHSLLVIEHNLDVIRSADWVIDLGPEGGDAGGLVVAAGTPALIESTAESHTGRALVAYYRQLGSSGAWPARAAEPAAAEGRVPGNVEGGAPAEGEQAPGRPLASVLRERARDSIFVHQAREHNLKNIDVEVPRDQLTVITGVSGSGKSTLAFDVIFGEGQRRYLESLNAYARQFVQPSSRPDVDGVFGIPPTVAIEQRTSRGGRKSTVATLTEIYHFLRLLYVKLGTQYCPDCQIPIEPQSFDTIVARIMRTYRGRHIGLLAPLVSSRKGLYADLAKWADARGFTHLRVDGQFLPTRGFPRLDRYIEHSIELPVADLVVDPADEAGLRAALLRALEHGKGVVQVAAGLEHLAGAIEAGDTTGSGVPLTIENYSTRRACRQCGRSFEELDPRLFSFNSKLGWCGGCYGTGLVLEGFDAEQTGEEERWTAEDGTVPPPRPARRPRKGRKGAKAAAVQTLDDEGELSTGPAACPVCAGRRLNPTALAVRVRDQSIADLTALPVSTCAHVLAGLDFSGREAEIARDLLAEIGSRLRFLADVGLGYLALERSAPTLSGGEAQRIRLAAQLGSNLQGVCYVLDEPTIGLHPRDNRVLLDTLDRLKAKGNTLLVVEHDEDTIRRADHVIDIGPGAGRQGGRVIATGDAKSLAQHPDSLTGRFLAQPLRHPLHPLSAPRPEAGELRILGADLHNLRGLDLAVPLARMTVITGVSGSGKSTLAREVLLANVQTQVQARGQRRDAPPLVGCAGLEGWEAIERVLEVDQTPIGKTPRSCPATYVGFWDAIRRLFADTTEARVRGFSASRFSFNTGDGRCPGCEGQGMQRIEMSFLPDVKVNCEVCRGARFNRETLAVRWRDKSIGDVLAMDVDEAVEFFAAHNSIRHPLLLLQQVGLGYLTLGQPSPTLSGGESQRIKLVTELAKVRDLTEEPATGGTATSTTTLSATAAGQSAASVAPVTSTTAAPARALRTRRAINAELATN